MNGGPIANTADRRVLDDARGNRAMTWIMAIMLFLTVLAAAAGLATHAATSLLDRQLAGRMTVQIVEPDEGVREARAARALAALQKQPMVKRATAVDRARLTELLRPWLGSDGADPDLPVPAMIDVELADPGAAAATEVTRAVEAAAPGARVDRHESWMAPIGDFMHLVTWLALSLVLLMAAATAAVVLLAARAGLDAHRDTIEVMHMLGSTDVQVARLFQRRVALDTLVGGAIGTVLAIGVVALVAGQIARLGSDLLSGLALGAGDWFLLTLLPLAFVLLATFAARLVVLGALRRTL